jgi:hypothetical protein
MPQVTASRLGTSVTTRPGAPGTPRWSGEPCQNLRAHPTTSPGVASTNAKSGRQTSEP